LSWTRSKPHCGLATYSFGLINSDSMFSILLIGLLGSSAVRMGLDASGTMQMDNKSDVHTGLSVASGTMHMDNKSDAHTGLSNVAEIGSDAQNGSKSLQNSTRHDIQGCNIQSKSFTGCHYCSEELHDKFKKSYECQDLCLGTSPICGYGKNSRCPDIEGYVCQKRYVGDTKGETALCGSTNGCTIGWKLKCVYITESQADMLEITERTWQNHNYERARQTRGDYYVEKLGIWKRYDPKQKTHKCDP